MVCAIAWGSESVLSSFAMESELSEIEALLIRQVTSFLSYLVIVLFSHQSFAEVAKRLSALSTRPMQVVNLLISTGTIWLRITSKS